MRSPVAPEVDLQPREIEPGLVALECPRSGGLWLPLQAYEQWKAQRSPAATAVHDQPVPVLDDSKRRTIICPESGCLLLRYKVGHGLPFHVDRSPATGGVWLDRGEWEALKQKGLHVDLNLIFTASYQREVRSAEYAEALESAFRERIGGADFARAAAFKAWLDGHPKRRDIWCYLQDELKAQGETTEPPPRLDRDKNPNYESRFST